MRILSLSTAMFGFTELALRNHTRYAAKHNHSYDFHLGSLDPSRPPAWSKLLHIERNLKELEVGEWLLWIDADAFFINQDIKLESLIIPDKDMVVCVDAQNNENTGVWFWRKCKWSMDYLRELWEQKQFIHHQWWENMAFMYTWKAHSDHIGWQPFKSMNTYPDFYQKGDFVLHVAGGNKINRLQMAVQQHPEVRDALV